VAKIEARDVEQDEKAFFENLPDAFHAVREASLAKILTCRSFPA